MNRKDTRSIRHARTREEILAAARELILEKGLEQFSLREVARRVDYSPAGLYEYFPGKGDILAELSGQALTKLTDALRLSGEGNGAVSLLSVGRGYIRFGMDNPQDFMLLFGRIPSSRQSIAELPGPNNPYGILMDAVIRHGKARGLHYPDDPEVLEAYAFGLWSLVHGQVMLRLTHLRDFRADFEKAAALTLQAYIDGLR